VRQLFTLVKASLLALLPFLLATAKTAHFGPGGVATFTTPPLADLLLPVNAALTAVFGYESAIRVVPTERDLSLFNGFFRLLNEFLNNRSTGYTSGRPLYHGLAS
jgi:hypothetical protein